MCLAGPKGRGKRSLSLNVPARAGKSKYRGGQVSNAKNRRNVERPVRRLRGVFAKQLPAPLSAGLRGKGKGGRGLFLSKDLEKKIAAAD